MKTFLKAFNKAFFLICPFLGLLGTEPLLWLFWPKHHYYQCFPIRIGITLLILGLLYKRAEIVSFLRSTGRVLLIGGKILALIATWPLISMGSLFNLFLFCHIMVTGKGIEHYAPADVQWTYGLMGVLASIGLEIGLIWGCLYILKKIGPSLREDLF